MKSANQRARKNWAKSGDKERLCEAQNHRCCYCGLRMVAGDHDSYPTLEHVTPLSSGGADELANIVIACRGCNEERNV